MQEDSFPAAEKILADIENIFKKDHKLRVFQVLPVTLNENKSPVVHIEHCLGLESWCIRHVYSHAYNHVMLIRKNKKKREDPGRLNRLLMGVLMINPEINSFWNMRKELLMQNKVDLYFDLHFTAVTLSRKPKCADIFSHRKWVIRKILKDLPVDPGLMTNELHICHMTADLYANNYHAWTHRVWCLGQGDLSLTDMITNIQREWLWSEKWVSTHVSDHSGLQYRQNLLTKLVDLSDHPCFQNANGFVDKVNQATEFFFKSVSFKDCIISDKIIPVVLRMVIAEYMLNTELISTFPGHEALWCHRRFILFQFRDVIFKLNCNDNTIKIWGCLDDTNHSNSDGEPLQKDKKIETNSVDRFAMLLGVYEETFIIKYYVGLSNPREIEYCNRHREWLSKVLKMQLPCNLDLLK